MINHKIDPNAPQADIPHHPSEARVMRRLQKAFSGGQYPRRYLVWTEDTTQKSIWMDPIFTTDWQDSPPLIQMHIGQRWLRTYCLDTQSGQYIELEYEDQEEDL